MTTKVKPGQIWKWKAHTPWSNSIIVVLRRTNYAYNANRSNFVYFECFDFGANIVINYSFPCDEAFELVLDT